MHVSVGTICSLKFSQHTVNIARQSQRWSLVKVINDIIRAFDVGDIALLSLLDLSSAFDIVDQDILLKRLEISFGLQSLPIKWFRSYLTGRFPTVSFGGRESKSEPVF